MATSLANILYPDTHTSGKKKPKPLTAVVGGTAKVAQQQKAPIKTTKPPMNAAK